MSTTMPSATEKIAISRAAKGQVLAAAASTKGSNRLAGKVGIISGVGPEIGIGTSTAKVFCREGVTHLYLVDIDDTGFPALVALLAKDYPNVKVTAIKADASSSPEIIAVVDRAIAEEGRLDFFFSNVGIMQVVPKGKTVHECFGRNIWEIEDDEFMQVLKVNTLSNFVAIKAASKAMLITNPEKGKTVPGGSIVLTSSVAALGAGAGPLPYDASKAGVVALARAASFSLAGLNTRVNVVCPGTILSNMSSFIVEAAEAKGTQDQIGSWCNSRRFGEGVELAHTVLFLVSDDASYVNGQTIVCDGGYTSNLPNLHV
ncbi:hypothetical protein IAT38_003006 [Cryptococcus sp. DSM 104549]